MKFFNSSLFHHHKLDFQNIEGYSDIKDIVARALESEENFNLLLCGPPASSKTLFLKMWGLEKQFATRKGIFVM